MKGADSIETLQKMKPYVRELADYACLHIGPYKHLGAALESLDRFPAGPELERLKRVIAIVEGLGAPILRMLRVRGPGPKETEAVLERLSKENEAVRYAIEAIVEEFRAIPDFEAFLRDGALKALGSESAMEEAVTADAAEVLREINELLRVNLRFGERVRAVDALTIHSTSDPDALKQLFRKLNRIPKSISAHPEVLNQVGQLYFAFGEPEQAMRCFAKASSRAPDKNRRALFSFNAFQAALQQGDFAAGMEHYQEVIQHGGHAYELFDTFAYFPEKILRSGSFGTSFLCRSQTARQCVVSAVWGGDISPDTVFERARMLTRANSPYVSRVLSWNWCDRKSKSGPYVVHEYVGGTPLIDAIQERGPLAPDVAESMLIALAHGLQAIHSAKISFCGIQPGNVLLRDNDGVLQPKIINVGLTPRSPTLWAYWHSKFQGKTTVDKELLATLTFAPPELRGEVDTKLGPYSDVYAFGKLGVFLLTGEAAADDERRSALIETFGPLAEILDICQRERPEERFPDFGEVMAALKNRTRPVPPKKAPEASQTPALWWTPAPIQSSYSQAQRVSVAVRNSLGIEFALIPPGRFLMGSPVDDESQRYDDEHLHDVALTRPFFMQATPVTQDEWVAVMGENPCHFAGLGSAPVENVNWYEALDFCNRLSEREGLEPAYAFAEDESVQFLGFDRTGYRLPTEAEWEYACRAGTDGAFSTGDRLSEENANYGINVGRPTPCKFYPSNPWGLYDVHGNVWEWCWDWYGSYDLDAATDPLGPDEGHEKVARGGSWGMTAKLCASSVRDKSLPTVHGSDLGFRIVRLATRST